VQDLSDPSLSNTTIFNELSQNTQLMSSTITLSTGMYRDVYVPANAEAIFVPRVTQVRHRTKEENKKERKR
jgi:hypothetical protein